MNEKQTVDTMAAKPLKCELEILKYYMETNKINENNNNDGVDYKEEASKIYSGYYLNLDEIINIFKEKYDNKPNAYLDIEFDTLEYFDCRPFQKSAPMETDKNKNNTETIVVNGETGIKNSEPDWIMNSIGNDESFKSALTSIDSTDLECFITDQFVSYVVNAEVINSTTIEENNNNNNNNKIIIINSSSNEEEIKQEEPAQEVTQEEEMNERVCSEQEIQAAEALCNLSQEIECGGNELLKSYQLQFLNALYMHNGTICYPIATNPHFSGMTYSLHTELENNSIIALEMFNINRCVNEMKMLT